LAQFHLHARGSRLALQIPRRLMELTSHGRDPGQMELAAQLFLSLEEGHPMPALCRSGSGHHASRTTADDPHLLGSGRLRLRDLELAAASRIHEAAHGPHHEHMVEAGLGAPDAVDDLIHAALARLHHDLRIRQQPTGHPHEVSASLPQRSLGQLGIVDTVARDYRQAHRFFHPAGQIRKGAVGDAHEELGDPGFVPPPGHVQAIHPGLLHGLAEHARLLIGVASGHEIVSCNAAEDREVRAHRLPNGPGHFHAKPHAVLDGSSVLVLPLVGEG